MSFKDDLRIIREKKKNGCVAYAYYAGSVYYSINGVNKEKDRPKFIEDMYKSKHKVQCKYLDSYTVINPKTFGHYILFKDNADLLLDKLENKKTIYIEDIIEPKKYDSSYDNRNWSCCERKIIGRLHDDKMICLNNHNIRIYVLERPCLLCVPMVTDVVYLDGNYNVHNAYYIYEKVAPNTVKIHAK